MAQRMTPEQMYSMVLTFDDVLLKEYISRPFSPNRGHGAPMVKFPQAYYDFVERAGDDEIDAFWDAIHSNQLQRAQEISGIKPSIVMRIHLMVNTPGGYLGSPSSVEYYFGDIPLHRWIDIVRNVDDQQVAKYWNRYVNRGKGPPWEGLSQAAQFAFMRLAEVYNEAVGALQ